MKGKAPEWELDEATSARLARIPQANTKPELIVRRAVAAAGHRFRLHPRKLPGRPDIANATRRWAIFVHGCYWHHHTGCARATVPRRNRLHWLAKFEANRRRDEKAVSRLEEMGFRVLTIWECETANTEKLAERISAFFKFAGSAIRKGGRRVESSAGSSSRHQQMARAVQ